MPKKLRLWTASWLAMALGCLLVEGCSSYRSEVEARRLVAQCNKVKAGMSYGEALKLMGQPVRAVEFENDGREKTRYYYLSPRLASTFTQLVVDKATGSVEEVICGETSS